MDTLILSLKEVSSLVTLSDCIRVMEETFRALGMGRVEAAPNSWLYINSRNAAVKLMGAYIASPNEALGVKSIHAFWDNPERGLPTTVGFMGLLDLKTGLPLALMDAAFVTATRTGAGGALATRYLARKDSKQVGILGTGVTARYTLMALKGVLPKVELVKVYSRSPAHRRNFVSSMRKDLGVQVMDVDEPYNAIKHVDVIITGTTSRKAILPVDWVEKGTHVNAMGQKTEIDPLLVKRAKVVGDDREVAIRDGKFSVAISQGVVHADDLYADLGEVVVGKKAGRTSDDEVTLFDSSGVAAQDVGLARFIYDRAVSKGVGTWKRMFEGIEQFVVE